jgi:outer membrane protein
MKKILFLSFLFINTLHQGLSQWSLEKCIYNAIERNLNVKNIDITLQGTEIDINRARQARYPSLNGSVGLNLNLGRSIDPTSNSFVSQNFLSNTVGLTSGVTLYNGNRINNTIKQAILNYKSATLTKEQVERDIALNVASIYLNVLFTRENVEIARNNYLGTKAQLEQIKKLVESGARAQNELYTLEAQLAANEQNEVSAQNAYNIAVIQLKQAILLGPDEDFELAEIPDNIEISTDPDIITLSELYTSARSNQKSIRAAEINVEAANVGIDIAKSALLPSIGLFGQMGTNYSNQGKSLAGFNQGYSTETVLINDMEVEIGLPFAEPILTNTPYTDQFNENLSYGFGLNVNIPIYNNFSTRGSIERAKLNMKSSQISLEQEEQNLYLAVQQAHADAKAAKIALNSTKKSLDAQELNYNNAKKRFNVNAISSFELTNIKSLYDNARVNYLLAKYDYIFRTKVLDFYMGKPIILK